MKNEWLGQFYVAPLVGAWIEIKAFTGDFKTFFVAPLVGAWIEICVKLKSSSGVWSLLSWERGLKYHTGYTEKEVKIVAPLVGAWIEIVT